MRQASAWGTHNTMREYASERGWLCGSSNVAPNNAGVRFTVLSPCSRWPQSENLIRGSSAAVKGPRSVAAQVQTVFTERPCRRSHSARRSRSQAHLRNCGLSIDAGLAKACHCHQGSCASLEIERGLHYFGGDDWPLGRAKPVTIPSSVKFACVRIFLRGVGSLRERPHCSGPLH